MKAHLESNLSSLRKNIQTLCRLNGKDSFFCPMIKANAYGHGVFKIAEMIQSLGIKKVGVISIEEALQLKEFTDQLEIYIFGPFQNETSIQILQSYSFIPVIGQWEDLKNLSRLQKKSIPFHLKFNTGMNRIGFQAKEAQKVADYVKKHSHLQVKGISSHLSEGEVGGSTENNQTRKQINLFKKIYKFFQSSFPEQSLESHLLNSAGWWSLWSHSQFDPLLGFRPGICLYGLKPPVIFDSKIAEQKYHSAKLETVARLKAFIIQCHELSSGEGVSYGRTWIADQPSLVATVSMGYADGLLYRLSNKGHVLFREKKVPIVGSICMDFFMIDATEAWDGKAICKGEEVVIFGQQGNHFLSVEEQAKNAGSLSYELLSGLGNRVERVYTNSH